MEKFDILNEEWCEAINIHNFEIKQNEIFSMRGKMKPFIIIIILELQKKSKREKWYERYANLHDSIQKSN
jgi:hypothetical protein